MNNLLSLFLHVIVKEAVLLRDITYELEDTEFK